MLVCLPSKKRGSDGLRDLPKSGLLESGGTTTHSHSLALQIPLPSHRKEKRTCQTRSTRRHHTSSLYPLPPRWGMMYTHSVNSLKYTDACAHYRSHWWRRPFHCTWNTPLLAVPLVPHGPSANAVLLAPRIPEAEKPPLPMLRERPSC